MDAIKPRNTRTAFLARRAPARRRAVLRSIIHRVTAPIARLSLKHMEQTKPMPDLMRSQTALIVICGSPATHRLGQHVASVLVVYGTAGGGIGWEVADAEQAVTEVVEEVEHSDLRRFLCGELASLSSRSCQWLNGR